MITHPHAEASYRTVPLEDGAFAVEITIPGTYPTTMRSFKTEGEAGEWVTAHKVSSSSRALASGCGNE